MQAIHRNFDEERAADAGPEIDGPTFELGGETFHCMAIPAGGVLPRVLNAVRFDDRGRRVYNAPDLVRFIEDVLCEEMQVPQAPPPSDDAAPALVEAVMVTQPVDDVERWTALMEDKKRPVPIETLGNVVMWLIEFYTDRPTTPPRR